MRYASCSLQRECQLTSQENRPNSIFFSSAAYTFSLSFLLPITTLTATGTKDGQQTLAHLHTFPQASYKAPSIDGLQS